MESLPTGLILQLTIVREK